MLHLCFLSDEEPAHLREMDVFQRFEIRLRERDCNDEVLLVQKIWSGWRCSPYPIEDLHRKLAQYLDLDLDLLDELIKVTLPIDHPREFEIATQAQATRDQEHDQACEVQTISPLLRLPREIRDKIWTEVLRDNVIHVSRSSEPSSKQRSGAWRQANLDKPKWMFHRCVAATGVKSAATPPEEAGDHFGCDTSGPSDVYAIQTVCKQTYLETLEIRTSFYARSAFQFPDLETAEVFLFGLPEKDRAAIRNLRIALLEDLMIQDHYGIARPSGWGAICNYFSNPWDRRTLQMQPQKRDKPWLVREPIYFYYSGCYYEQNRDRLYKRWQVGRGNTSWDISISSLIYRGLPKLDLAIKVTHDEELSCSDDDLVDNRWDPDTIIRHAGWLKPLMRFRDWEGLDIELYDEDGVTTELTFEVWKEELKEVMRPQVGPRFSMFFTKDRYGTGDTTHQRYIL